MVSMAILGQVCVRESIERKPWNSEARNDVIAFFAQSFGVVCAAIFLYSLGPSLGMTLMVVSFAVWSFLRSQTASTDVDDGADEDYRHAAAVNSPSRFADPVWSRNSGMSSVSSARPVLRQGA